MRPLLVQLLLRLMACLPLKVVHWVGAFIGRRMGRPGSKPYRISAINISHCFPQQSPQEQQQLAQQSLMETGKTLTETGVLWFGSPARVRALFQEVHGEEHIEAGITDGHGVILAIPHLGNWEAVGLYCSDRHSMTSLYRPPRMAALDTTIRTARQRFGATLVPTNAKGVKSLYQALSKNYLVAILPDQDPRRGAGEFAPFFGIQANTMTLLSRLAHKTKAKVICAYAERLPNSHGFALHFIPVEEGVSSTDTQTSLIALNQSLERAIQTIPTQYQWSYKRFETRPEGEKGFY